MMKPTSSSSPRSKGMKATCAISLETNLEELRRRSNLESLRPFVTAEQCFPPQTDPLIAVITMEELKKLARAWKLHERRNFWKQHPDRDSMVTVLLQHIEDNAKLTGKSTEASSTPPKSQISGGFQPVLPASSRPSRLTKLPNYCGMKYFLREVEPKEIVVHSRFYEAPEVDTAMEVVVNRWRGEDFNLKLEDDKTMKRDATGNSSQLLAEGSFHDEEHKKTMKVEAMRQIKHRHLAAHLARFSTTIEATTPGKPSTITSSSVQTFINIAETSDAQVGTYAVIGLANIASNQFARAVLVEINAVHKFTTLIPLIRGFVAHRAASLLFYYFSCDGEIEDRIYNASMSLLLANGASEDSSTLVITLDTLSNLLPCLDRNRVTELMLNIIHQNFMPTKVPDENRIIANLEMILNATAFSNTHTTLLGHYVLEILVAATSFSMRTKNSRIALLVSKILMALLQLGETTVQHVMGDYVCLVIDLLAVEDINVFRHCFRIIAVLSSNLTLLEQVMENDVISAVTRIIESRDDLPMDVCKDAAKYFSNICRPLSLEYMKKLMDELVPVTILKLMQTAKQDLGVQEVAVRGLQNILSFQENCIELAKICCMPLLRMMKDYNEIGAANSMFNLACVVECEPVLSGERVHLKILSYLMSADKLAKNAYLRILVQLSGSPTCINEMLSNNLISILLREVQGNDTTDVWVDVTLLLLAVVIYRSDLKQDDIKGILAVLSRICVTGANHTATSSRVTEQLLVQCSTVLAFLSLQITDFSTVDDIMRSILQTSCTEPLMESASTVIYNITCSESQMQLLLKDGLYVNVMIKMMRSAKPHVQEIVAEAIRTLCSSPRCIELLLGMDLLSDLIVIALLRTSSENIKIVCNEAFFNMLCNTDTRIRLLKGDLWWAVMRLSRTDTKRILHICGRALYDLSCDGDNTNPLRDHHILSFIKDITVVVMGNNESNAISTKITDGDVQFLELCLRCIQNFASRFVSSGVMLAQHEVSSVLYVLSAIMPRTTDIGSIRCALNLLLKCAQELPRETVAGCNKVEIDKVLSRAVLVWGVDQTSCLLVTRIFWELTKCIEFTKVISIADIIDSLAVAYHGGADGSHGEYAVEATENVVSCFLHYAKSCSNDTENFAVANSLLSSNVWSKLVCDVFAVSRAESTGMVVEKPPSLRDMSQLITTPSIGTSIIDRFPRRITSLRPIAFPVATRALVLCLMVHIMFESLKYPQTMPLVVVQSILTLENVSVESMKANIMYLISNFSKVSLLSGHLLESDVFKILKQLMKTPQGQLSSRQTPSASGFCSTILANISIHRELLPRLVSGLGSSIDELLLELLEDGNVTSCLNVSLFCYNCVMFSELQPEAPMNPTFVINTLFSMNKQFADNDELVALNKFIVGIVLNKYDLGGNVNPLYVQAIFNEMQQSNVAKEPKLIESLSFVDLGLTYRNSNSLLKLRKSVPVTLQLLPDSDTKWSRIVIRSPKVISKVIANMASIQPVICSSLEKADPFPPHTFAKVIVLYPKIQLDSSVTEQFQSDEQFLHSVLEESEASSIAEAELSLGDTGTIMQNLHIDESD